MATNVEEIFAYYNNVILRMTSVMYDRLLTEEELLLYTNACRLMAAYAKHQALQIEQMIAEAENDSNKEDKSK